MTTTIPVKGTVWTHARRKDWNDKSVVYTVTSVSTAKNLVYSTNPQGTRIKTPLDNFGLFVLDVVSTPTPEVKGATVKMSDFTCESLHRKARTAGLMAGEAAIPTPMFVVEHASPMDDTSPVVSNYAPVMEGACGFAWIRLRPATSSFARWAKKNGFGYPGYYGGFEISVKDFGQSLERKTAYARAYAEVLKEAGITGYPQSRMD